VVKK
jgi:hypothetical protein